MAEVITIDRQARDVLCGFLESDAMDAGEFAIYVAEGDREQARTRSTTAAYVCTLLDELGWPGDDVRTSYNLGVEHDKFAHWLRRQRASTEGARRDDVRSLDGQEAGQEDRYYLGCSQEESIAKSRSYIERDDRDLRIIDELLSRLEPAGAVA